MASRCNKCRENDGCYIIESGRWISSDVCSPEKIKVELTCWYCDNHYEADIEFKSLNAFIEFKEKHQPYND